MNNKIDNRFLSSKQKIIKLIITILILLLAININCFGDEALNFKEAQFLYSTQREESLNIIWKNNRITYLPKMVFAFIYTTDTPHGKIFISVELKGISYFNTSKDNPKILLQTRFYSQDRVGVEDLYLYKVSGLRQNIFYNDTRESGKLPNYYGEPKKIILRNESSTFNNLKTFKTYFDSSACNYKCLRDDSINIFYKGYEYVIFVDDKAIKSVIDVFLSAVDKNYKDWYSLSQ